MTNHLITRIVSALVCAALFDCPTPALAQSSVSDVLDFLVTNQTIATGNPDRDRAAAQATSDTISRALLANIATLPISTSSGGFVYRLDPTLGTVERQSASFGPVFVERAIGPGQGSASIGLTFQHMQFTSLDGRHLRDGSLVTTANQFVDEPQPFDVDRLTLNLDADVATVHANFGLTDDSEIGVALPFVALRVDGSRVDVYRGQTFTQASASATAIGMADMLLHAKYGVYHGGLGAWGAAADFRLPTGRQRDLLGAGAKAVKVSAIGSLAGRSVTADGNVGYTFGGLANELSYAGALTAASSDRLTWTAEIIGRWMDTPGQITSVALPHPTLRGAETLRLLPSSSTTRILALAPGFKWNASDTWVVVASFTVPLTSGGLTTPFTPLGGVDYGLR